MHTHLFDAAFRSSASSNSSSPESLFSSGGSDFASTASFSPSCISTSSPSTAAAAFAFGLPFLIVDLGFLVSALERREVALEELASWVSLGGGGDAEGAGLKLRDGASGGWKEGVTLSHIGPNNATQKKLTRARRRAFIFILLILFNHPLSSFLQWAMTF